MFLFDGTIKIYCGFETSKVNLKTSEKIQEEREGNHFACI